LESRVPGTLVAIAALLCFGTTQTIGRVQSSGVEFSYSLPSSITLREPVVVTATIENRSSGTVTVDLGNHHVQQFAFMLTSPRGVTVSARPQPEEGLYAGPIVSIEVGQRNAEPMVLNRWLQFDQPGTYELRIRFLGTVRAIATNTTLDVGRMFVTNLTVLPRDVEQLKSKCESLAALVAHGTTASERIQALQQLAYVNDSVAVPYLRAAVEAGGNPSEAIQGLVRIGGPEARDAVLALATSPDRLVAAAARNALSRMK